MPPLSKPQGVAIGQIGQVQSVSPRAEDTGIGSVLQKSAQMIFGAGQTEVNTGSQMTAQGVQQTALGEELMKPFKKIRDSKEVLAAEELAIDATLTMRAKVQAMQSGQQPEFWGEGYQQILSETKQEYLSKAAGISEAAHEHVASEIGKERLSGFTKLLLDAEKSNIGSQEVIADKLRDFTFREALAGGPEVRLAQRNRFVTKIDQMVFNGVLTPTKGKQKVDEWDKQLVIETGIQVALMTNTESGHRIIDNSNLLPDDKRESKNKINDAVSFRVKEKNDVEQAAEKQLKVDQGAAMTEFQGAVMRSSNLSELIQLSFNAKDYVVKGVLGANDGPQLQGLINSRIKELQAPIPEKDSDGVPEIVLDRILADPETMTDQRVAEIPGLTFSTKMRLLDKLKEQRDTTHYRHIESFKSQKAIISALKTTEVSNSERVQAQIKGTAQYNYNEAVARALRVHDQMASGLRNELKQPLTDTDIRRLDGEVDKIVEGIKKMKWSETSGSPLSSYK